MIEAEDLPLVSIITATFNAAETIQGCLESVRLQDYPAIEHIIVDGASSDRTMEIVRREGSPHVRWVSEPDEGFADAWNKGVALAQGQWLAFVGADDVLLPDAVTSYMRLAAKNPEAQYLSSKVRWVAPDGSPRIIGKPWSWPRFQRYMCTAHVGSMHHRELLRVAGAYDASLPIVADYELLLRFGSNLKTAFLPQVTAVMRSGGNSDVITALDETAHVKLHTGHRSPLLVGFERRWGRFVFRTRSLIYRTNMELQRKRIMSSK